MTEASAVDEAAGRLVGRSFVSLAAAALAFYIAAGILLPVTPPFVEGQLGGGTFEVGIVVASLAIASLVLRPVVGWSSDRYGRRPLLIVGAMLTVAGVLLHLPANDIGVLVAARALLGAGEAFFLVAALAAASDLAPPSRRGEALSFFSLSLYLGIGIGPLIGEAVLDASGFAAVWIVTVAIAAVAVGLSLLIPETAPVSTAGTDRRPRPPLIHPKGLFPGLIALTGMWGMAGFFTFLPAHARSVGLDGASAPLALYAVTVVVLRVVGARVPDRYGSVRVGSAALGLAAVGLAMVGLLPTSAGLLAGTVVFAAGVAFIMPALVSLAVASVPAEERGTVVGTTAIFLDVAFGIAPAALGAIAASTGEAPTFLLSSAIALGGCLVLATRMARQPATT
jgi:MFS family permease